jgi:hypothetical protein
VPLRSAPNRADPRGPGAPDHMVIPSRRGAQPCPRRVWVCGFPPAALLALLLLCAPLHSHAGGGGGGGGTEAVHLPQYARTSLPADAAVADAAVAHAAGAMPAMPTARGVHTVPALSQQHQHDAAWPQLQYAADNSNAFVYACSYVFGNTTINYTQCDPPIPLLLNERGVWRGHSHANHRLHCCSASIMFVAIVIFSVLLEVVIHTMAHATEDKPHYREMVQKVYAELTILGFISFSLTIVREVARESSGGETIEVRRLILPCSFFPATNTPPSVCMDKQTSRTDIAPRRGRALALRSLLLHGGYI